MQQKQIVIEKLLDLQKNRFQNNCFESTSKTPYNRLSNFNKMNRLNPVDGSRENPQSNVKQRSNHHNNPNQNSNISQKVMVIVDSIVKYSRSDESSSTDKSISIMNHPCCSSQDMVDYVKPIARQTPDRLIIHVGINDLTKSVNTMKKVRKCVEVIREIDNTENIQTGFSSIIQRALSTSIISTTC